MLLHEPQSLQNFRLWIGLCIYIPGQHMCASPDMKSFFDGEYFATEEQDYDFEIDMHPTSSCHQGDRW